MSIFAAVKKNKVPLLGLFLLGIGLVILGKVFSPVVKEEIKYSFTPKTTSEIVPVSTDFGLVIPKIRANTKVIANVDPYNEKEYQWQLTKGVAHARGTVFPGQTGNVFIFAHSAADFLQANQFNAVFYLLNKLEVGDEIIVYYHNQKYKYLVSETKIVGAGEVKYLSNIDKNNKTLTLMTCWPPGTTINRLIVYAFISS